ncbi:pyridoxamine 5'-phosphate oxidase family protein [Actinocrispum wychmicini]|uniref:PPOX class probable F420-dependent enzyme n=1 Tax=Actinocrispum wychmicini TaxID=1213861 RepID=A0A4R2JZC0_9PSEU|nr:pyridoxamine 5'-phosphate oxidase family protein [Actinocrispum wychmicini]TCO62776.1 PPOX class probable F420-dependent enzyme [Actinocrispum wychmicini]
MAADLALVQRLAAADHGLAIVATTRADGSVHASLVNAGVLDNPVSGAPSVALVARGGAAKLTHLRRVGRATVTFRAGWDWVSVDGPVTIIGPDDPHPDFPADRVPGLLRDVFTAAGGTHEDWAEYDRVMAEERRTAVFIETQRVISN